MDEKLSQAIIDANNANKDKADRRIARCYQASSTRFAAPRVHAMMRKEDVMEQRRDARYTLWFPVDVTTHDGAKHTLAVAKDVSRSGIGVSSPAGLEIGATVTLSFKVPPDTGEQRTVTGSVVRHERNPDDPHGLWPHRIGIAFAEPIPELETVLASMKS